MVHGTVVDVQQYRRIRVHYDFHEKQCVDCSQRSVRKLASNDTSQDANRQVSSQIVA